MSVHQKIIPKLRHFGFISAQKIVSFLFKPKYEPSASEQRLIQDLHVNGVHVTSVEELFQDDAQNIMLAINDASAAFEVLDSKNLPDFAEKKASSYDMLSSTLISKFPELFFSGLSNKLLNIVENYIHMPAAYHGVALRCSMPDGIHAGTRFWHKDGEDFRVFRMVIYLNDVEEGGGPFEYLPRTYGVCYNAFKGIESKITTDEMLKVVPQEALKQVYGKAGTVIICDTANTFHHEMLQEKKSRSVAMFGFSSRIPKNISLAKRHFPAESIKAQLLPLLTKSQKDYVYGWRDGFHLRHKLSFKLGLISKQILAK